VRVRSDIERKRSHGLNALAWSGAAVGEGLYTDGNTARTYEQLLEHARVIAGAGFPVIVDATFLRIAYRAAFHALALALGVPFAILHMEATPAEMRARLAARAAGGADASDATLEVLEAQIRGGDELTGEELSDTVIAADSNTATLSGISAELARRLLTPLRGQAGAQTTAAG
jgi:predicted kinase